jgi:phage baseplate assembly protein W
MLKDLTATNMQLAYLFGTPQRDRDFWPTFGCPIPDLLFEPCHPDTAQSIRNAAIVAVTTWQPRIRLIISRCEVIPIIEAQVFVGNFPYAYVADGQQSDAAQVYFRSRQGFDPQDGKPAPIGDGRPVFSGTRSFCARYP